MWRRRGAAPRGSRSECTLWPGSSSREAAAVIVLAPKWQLPPASCALPRPAMPCHARTQDTNVRQRGPLVAPVPRSWTRGVRSVQRACERCCCADPGCGRSVCRYIRACVGGGWGGVLGAVCWGGGLIDGASGAPGPRNAKPGKTHSWCTPPPPPARLVCAAAGRSLFKSMAMAADGEGVVTTTIDKRIQLWSLHSPEPSRVQVSLCWAQRACGNVAAFLCVFVCLCVCARARMCACTCVWLCVVMLLWWWQKRVGGRSNAVRSKCRQAVPAPLPRLLLRASAEQRARGRDWLRGVRPQRSDLCNGRGRQLRQGACVRACARLVGSGRRLRSPATAS